MKILNYILASFALVSCVSQQPPLTSAKKHPPLAENFAYERAASIAQHVPTKVGRFILEEVKARQATVYLSLRVINTHDSIASSVTSEINAISYGLCQNKKTALVIQQGVNYHLSIFNKQRVRFSQATINKDTCTSKQFVEKIAKGEEKSQYKINLESLF